MATIKAKYASEDEVPEQHKELYEERQGEWILVNIEGIDTEGNVHRLTTANTKLRTENNTLKNQLEAFNGKKPEEVLTMTERIAELEAQVEAGGKPDEDKVNSLVEARIKTRIGPLERDLKKAQEEAAASSKLVGELQGTITKSKITDAVSRAGTKAKVVPSAMEDVLALSGGIFEVVDVEGKEKVVTRDGVGVTPGLEPDAYFVEVAPVKTHWFPGSQGAGANGGKGSVPGINGNNPWSRENWNLTEQGRIMRDQGADKAQQYAKAAGSALHATRPPEAKK